MRKDLRQLSVTSRTNFVKPEGTYNQIQLHPPPLDVQFVLEGVSKSCSVINPMETLKAMGKYIFGHLAVSLTQLKTLSQPKTFLYLLLDSKITLLT